MKLSLALLCLALACTAAYASNVDVAALHKQLQAVDPSLAAISSSNKATIMSGDYYKYDSKDDYYNKYEKKYEDKYEKYDDKYEKKHDEYYGKDKYEDKYEKKYEDKYYGKDKYEDKYEKKYEDKYYGKDKYEKKEKYDDKYYDYKGAEEYYYGAADKKTTIKLWEKSRSPIRAQKENPDTYQFSSIVTCENPKAVKELHSSDGVIDIPVNPELKTTPVGVCEWTVNKVAPQFISEHAEIKGATTVVCTFTEEAERVCKSDLLCDKMSISASGLLYHFDKAPTDYGYGYKKDEYKEPAELNMDVTLNLISGVNSHKKKVEYDNGVIQFYIGDEAKAGDKTEVKNALHSPEDPTGSYTIVLSGGKHY